MYEVQDVLDVAHAVRPHLTDLLGATAPAVEVRLGELLRRAESGDEVKMDLLRLLAEYPATRQWAQRELERPYPERSFRRSVGAVQDIGTPRYVCEQGHVEFRLGPGDPIPTVCPKDGTRFVRDVPTC